jgi:GntR family transcriptional regulator
MQRRTGFRRATVKDAQISPQRAYNLLRSSIRAGLVEPGDRLDETAIRKSLSTSRNATRQALQMLADDGLVSRQVRLGTVVVADITTWSMDLPAIAMPKAPLIWREVDRRRINPPPVVALKLQIEATEQVWMLEHVLSKDGRPHCVRTDFFPVSQVAEPGQAADMQLAMWRNTGAVVTVVEATSCSAKYARLLEIDEGCPVLTREMLLIDFDEHPQKLSFHTYPSDRVAFSMTTHLDAHLDEPEEPATPSRPA